LADQHPGRVIAVEPNISELPSRMQEKLELCDLKDALQRADVLVILVDHASFKGIDQIRLHAKVVIDTRGMLSRA
jgi:UDP-N-acetyl-D-mannosaminuronic acid dehydrogenase